MLEALRQRLLDTQRQLAKVNAALASASEENEQLRADLRKLQQWAMAQSDADDSELPLPHHMQ
jgi:regulator of replication initiation timing